MISVIKPKFILASASPRRLHLLAQIGLKPDDIIPSDIDETPFKNEPPDAYASRMTEEKCALVASRYPDAVVLAADTVVACGRRILPKAGDEKTARECLKLLSGRRHRVYTAVAVQQKNRTKSTLVLTQVKFKHLSEEDIAHYIRSHEWQGKAGGYAIQGRAESFIPWIRGSYSNVVGLPIAETGAMLAGFGITQGMP